MTEQSTNVGRQDDEISDVPIDYLEFADLTKRLSNLAESARALHIEVTSEDLKHRCNVLSQGATIAIGLLQRMPETTSSRQHHQLLVDAAFSDSISDGVETKFLYKLGWLATELGFEDDGLALLNAVGTLLHGRVGGAVFKIESLLAIGSLKEASVLYKSEISGEQDVQMSADAIFSSLWSQRGDALWSAVKARTRTLD